jgi:hypothetical protein
MTRNPKIHSLKCCQQAKALLERVLGMIATINPRKRASVY